MNTVSFVGRLTRDLELVQTQSGHQRLNNCLAINRPYKSDSGDDTDFIPFVAWGKRAELLSEYCQKGDRIGLCGRMQSRKYQNKQDQTVYVVELLVQQIEFLESRKSEDSADSWSSTAQLQSQEL